jgi:hypothetical protein
VALTRSLSTRGCGRRRSCRGGGWRQRRGRPAV